MFNLILKIRLKVLRKQKNNYLNIILNNNIYKAKYKNKIMYLQEEINKLDKIIN
jgi:hypothetical protein